MAGEVVRYETMFVIIAGVATGVTFPITHQTTLIDSTTANLGGGATYTGPAWVDVSGYVSIIGTCFADQNGTLYLDFSSDGVNADGTPRALSYFKNRPFPFTVTPRAPFFRLRYTNGAVGQGTFRLYAFGKV